jgi:hypothetical protein
MYVAEAFADAALAGFGEISDGVPELLDGDNTLPPKPRRPPRHSDPLAAFDKTAVYRKL